MRPTATLAAALNELGEEAPAFLSASAVGYYGDRSGERLDETSGPGHTFLSQLCVEWENAARAAEGHTPVTLLRNAPILHPRGVLKPMILLARLGLGGPLGRGTQTWPWITLDDEVRAIRHILDNRITGPVDLTGPTPASASDIGRALSTRLRRPYWLPAPEWALRAALGDAAESLLLSDADVCPQVLLDGGFSFQRPTAEDAIASAIS